MKQTVTFAMLATASLAALADPGLKPGLWEMHFTKSVVDGRDQSARMAGVGAKMQEAMARLTPEQREQMGALMQQHGGVSVGDGGAIRICLTPEMAKRDVPVIDREGACQPTNVTRDGSHFSYEIQCAKDGTTISGKGESSRDGDTVTNRSDTTVVERGQTHRTQNEIELKFVSSDCGSVRPVGAGAKP